MGVICHATILIGLKFDKVIEDALIKKFGEDYNIRLFEENIVILPYDRCQNCEALIGMTISDIDELTLLRVIKGLQNGVDMAGIELNGSPEFFTGCYIQPSKDDIALKAELALAEKKVKEGAQFIVTPPVFNIPAFIYFKEKAKELGVPIIATVLLLKSVAVARYISTNIPGPPLPDEIIPRIRKAPDRINECINIAGETINNLRELCQGVQLVTMGWESRIPAILDVAGI